MLESGPKKQTSAKRTKLPTKLAKPDGSMSSNDRMELDDIRIAIQDAAEYANQGQMSPKLAEKLKQHVRYLENEELLDDYLAVYKVSSLAELVDKVNRTALQNFDPYTADQITININGAYGLAEAKKLWPEGFTGGDPENHNAPNVLIPAGARPRLNIGEAEAIVAYSYQHDHKVNRPLRAGQPMNDEAQDLHNRLQSAFAKAQPLKPPIKVNRGLNFRDDLEQRTQRLPVFGRKLQGVQQGCLVPPLKVPLHIVVTGPKGVAIASVNCHIAFLPDSCQL